MIINAPEQKKVLFQQIKQLKGELEGIELQDDQLPEVIELTQQKDRLDVKISSLQQESKEINQRITQLSNRKQAMVDGLKKKLLQSMKPQRWWFFKNKQEILFDRHTGYLWPNLNQFQLLEMDRSQVDKFVKKLKLQGYAPWNLPTLAEMKTMIQDQSFPFWTGGNHRIMNQCYFFLNSGRVDLDNFNTGSYSSAYSLLCHKSFSTERFNPNLNFYQNDLEQESQLLDFFLEQGWEPLFAKSEDQEIFLKVRAYYDSLAQLKNRETLGYSSAGELSELLSLPNSAQQEEPLTSAHYYEQASQWLGQFIGTVQNFMEEQAEAFNALRSNQNQLKKQTLNQPFLQEIEKNCLDGRRAFLLQSLDFDLDEVTRQLQLLLDEVNCNKQALMKAIQPGRSLSNLYAIEHHAKPSLSFLQQYSVKLVQDTLKKYDQFAPRSKFILQLIEQHFRRTEAFLQFVEQDLPTFREACAKEGIGSAEVRSWSSEWRKEQAWIEEKVTVLLEGGLKEKIQPEILLNLLKALHTYSQGIHDFYQKERRSLYQRYAFQSGGQYQEKLEVQAEMTKILEKFLESLEQELFAVSDLSERTYLAQWADEWMKDRVTQVLSLVPAENPFGMKSLSQDLLQEFQTIRKRNFETYLQDAKTYAEARKEQLKSYYSLLFRMRKELTEG